MKKEVSKYSEQIMEQDYNEKLGLPSIKETLSKPLGKQMLDTSKMVFTHDWIFGSWYEKLIVAGSFLFSVYTLVKFLLLLIK